MASKSMERYVRNLSSEERHVAFMAMLERLIELEEVSYVMDDIDSDEDLIWSAVGVSLRESHGVEHP